MSIRRAILFSFIAAFYSSGIFGEAARAEDMQTVEPEAQHQASSPQPVFSKLGTKLNESRLSDMRGGDVHVNQQDLSARLSDTSASNLTTGANTISGGSFANSSGLPIVIQNSGNGVIIQNSTILNLNMQ